MIDNKENTLERQALRGTRQGAFRVRLLFLTILSLTFTFSFAIAGARGQELSDEKKKIAVKKLIREYDKARKDPEKQQQLLEEGLEYGLLAAELFQKKAVLKRLERDLKIYGKEFSQAVTKSTRQQLADVNAVEVLALQQQFWLVSNRENLSKSMIKTEIDPLLERLEALLVVEREAVFQTDDELSELRENLLIPGSHWEQCAVMFYDEMMESIDDEELRKMMTPPSFEDYLRGDEDLMLRLAMPMNDTNRAVLAVNSKIGKRVTEEEARVS